MKSYKVFVFNSKNYQLESVYVGGEFKIVTKAWTGKKVLPACELGVLGQGPLSFNTLEDALQFRLDAKNGTKHDLHVWECEFQPDDLLHLPEFYLNSFSENASIEDFKNRTRELVNNFPDGTVCTKQLTLVKRLV